MQGIVLQQQHDTICLLQIICSLSGQLYRPVLYALPNLEGENIIIFVLYLSHSESILINEENKQNGRMT